MRFLICKPAFLKLCMLLVVLPLLSVNVLAQDDGLSSGAIKGGRIRIEIGQAHLMKDVDSYEITNQSILGASVTNDGGLILKGKNPGTTTLLIRKSGLMGIIVYEVDVIGVNIENTLTIVKAALGEIVGLSIRKEGNIIVLEGDVVSRNDGLRVDKQIGFFRGVILDLTSRSYLANDLVLLRQELKNSNLGELETQAELGRDGEQQIIIRGSVTSVDQKEEAIATADKFFPGHVVDQVQVDHPLIEVDVEVYSIDYNKAHAIGTNDLLGQITDTRVTPLAIQTGPIPLHPNTGSSPSSRVIGSYPVITFAAGGIRQKVVANITDGVITNVSKQHASVRSGLTAQIDNVTDAYVLVAGGLAATLEKVTVGQSLSISPTVLKDGMFSTTVAIELSENTGSTAADIPISVAKRKMESDYISAIDERIVLGGVEKQNANGGENRTPLLGRIPVVNLFFRAKTNNYNETVQVYFMTLRLPNAFDADDDAQSKPAVEQRDVIKDGVAKQKRTLDRRIRWE